MSDAFTAESVLGAANGMNSILQMSFHVKREEVFSLAPARYDGSERLQTRRHLPRLVLILLMSSPHDIYDEAIRIKDSGDMDGAVAKLREVLDVDPVHSDTHSALAVYLQKLGDCDAAIEHAIKVVEIAPDDPFSYTQLSVIYMRCNRIPEAEEAKAKAHMVQMGGGPG